MQSYVDYESGMSLPDYIQTVIDEFDQDRQDYIEQQGGEGKALFDLAEDVANQLMTSASDLVETSDKDGLLTSKISRALAENKQWILEGI